MKDVPRNLLSNNLTRSVHFKTKIKPKYIKIEFDLLLKNFFHFYNYNFEICFKKINEHLKFIKISKLQ